MILSIFGVFQFDSCYYFERVSAIPHHSPVLWRKHRSIAILACFIFLYAAEDSLLEYFTDIYSARTIQAVAFYSPSEWNTVIGKSASPQDLQRFYLFAAAKRARVFLHLDSEVFDRRVLIPEKKHKLFHRLFLKNRRYKSDLGLRLLSWHRD